MTNLLIPKLHIEHIRNLDLDSLKSNGIKGILTDLDNTLVAPMEDDIDEEILSIFKRVQDHGIKIAIITNSGQIRTEKYIAGNDINYIHSAKKPLKGGFLKGLELLDLPAEEVAIIGDQLLTDVLGGNSLGLYTILVNPFAKKEKPQTYVNRFFERIIITYLSKRGLIKWKR